MGDGCLILTLVGRASFNAEQKRWLFEHSQENFRVPADATPLGRHIWYRRVWNDFSNAFPDNVIGPNNTLSIRSEDLFERYLLGRVRLVDLQDFLSITNVSISKSSALRAMRHGLDTGVRKEAVLSLCCSYE